mgnify:CR=1 FL=1
MSLLSLRRVVIRCFVGVVALAAELDLACGADLIGRRGVDIQGKAEGSIRLLAGSEVQVAPGADVKGRVILPMTEAPEVLGQTRESRLPATLATLRGTLEGRRIPAEAAETFVPVALPVRTVTRTGSEVVIRGSAEAPATIVGGADVRVEFRLEAVGLAPGDYGRLVVRNARVVLGVPDPSRRTRYGFASMDVGPGGRVDLAGPVTVEIGELSAVEGCLGKPRFADWLDLRVANESLQVQVKGELHAAMQAARAQVVLADRGRAEGWILADRVTVGERAAFRGREMAVGRAAVPLGSAPLVRAVFRLESGLAEAGPRLAPGFRATAFVENERAGVRLEPDATVPEHAEHAMREALLRTLTHAFFASGLPEVSVDAGVPGDLRRRRMVVNRDAFIAVVDSLAGAASLPERIAEIAASPLKLNLLELRLAAIAARMTSP